jgi:hypothetical protein
MNHNNDDFFFQGGFYTVIREHFLNKQIALYVLSLNWRKGYYGAYRTPSILRLFLFFFRK